MFIKIWSVVYLGIFLVKILKYAKIKNMLAFAFGLSVVFGTYVGHCILSYFLWKEKTKIIAEVDLTIRNYESTVSDKYLHSEKNKKIEV